MKKGFTLIELLAVIIILAVIALIATPVVLNVVDNAKESSYDSSVNGLLDAAHLYYAESLIEESGSEKIENIKNLNNIYSKVTVQGEKPEGGELYVNENGQTAIAVKFGEKCYKKMFTTSVEKNVSGDCTLGNIKDKTNPTVIYAVVGSPFNSNGWAKSDFDVTVKINDMDSGGQKFEYCITQTDCEPSIVIDKAEENITITTNSATNKICVIGYDVVGNKSDKTCSDIYKLDKESAHINGSAPSSVTIGQTVKASSYFSASFGISGGSLQCSNNSIYVMDTGMYCFGCKAVGNNGTTQNASSDCFRGSN